MRAIENIQGELRAANKRLARAMDKREEWILVFRAEGATLRVIGDAAQMTAEGVQAVLRRAGTPRKESPGRRARAEAAVREWTQRAWEAADERDALIKELLEGLSGSHSLAEIGRLAGVSPTNLVYMTSRRRRRLQRPRVS